MCGIAGFFKLDRKEDKERDKKVWDILTVIFEETKSRGSDASGFSYLNEFNELKTVKGPISSSDMIKEKKWLDLAEKMPNSMIAHCRAWTKGEPLNNFNNHPIVVNREIALIHNGCIGNDDEIKEQCITGAKGEVDSEAIPLFIQTNLNKELGDDFHNPTPDNIIKSINETAKEIYGGYACGMLHKATPDFLYLFDHNNPVVLAYVPELETIFFASEAYIVKKAFDKHLPGAEVEESELLHRFFRFSKKEPVKQRYSIDRVADNTIVVLGLYARPVLKDGGVAIKNLFEMKFFDLDANFSRQKPVVVNNLNAMVADDDEIVEETTPLELPLLKFEMPKRKAYVAYSAAGTNANISHLNQEEDWENARLGFV